MHTLTLSESNFKALATQFENKADGYTLQEIRQLDKILKIIENIKPTTDNQNVSLEFENSDYDFMKDLWKKSGPLKGLPETRKIIIEIDDAFN